MRKFFRFLKRLWDYLPIIWQDEDFDYGYTIRLMMFKFKRLRDHVIEHDIIEDAEKVGKEIDKTIELYERYIDMDYDPNDLYAEERAWNEFFDYMRDNLRNWWD